MAAQNDTENKNRPLIGINLDYYPDGATPCHPLLDENASAPAYSPYAHHVINFNYVLAIEQAGGVPVAIPHGFSSIERYVDMLDGFVFSGGLIDLQPEVYGEALKTDTLYRQDQRARFDIELMRKALESNKPILGVCAGVQLLNVVRGGTLYQHIPDIFPDSDTEHFDYHNRNDFVHDVNFEDNSKLAEIFESKTLGVNSSHHMAIKDPGRGLKVTARSPDGVAEGVECAEKPFVIGVQWHPEFFRDTAHQNLFSALIKAANSGRGAS
mgnify:CR=1 FL=1